MKYFLFVIGSFSILSCSSLVDIDSTEFSQIERVQVDQENYDKPQFYIDDFKIKEGSRSIASAAPIDGEVTSARLSNRQVYFLTMYKQFKTMERIIGKTDEKNSCPSFHNVVLEHASDLNKHSDIYGLDKDFSHLRDDKVSVTKFPIMAIPYSSKQDLFSALVDSEFDSSSLKLKKAFTRLYHTQKKEISELCDKGVSPGYYIYENLVSYFKNDPSFHKSRRGLKALLKVPVISNMIILDNLIQKDESYFQSGVNKFENSFLNRSQISWFNQYREKLKAERRSYLGSRSVAGEKL